MRLESQIRVESECLGFAFQVSCFVHGESIAYSLARLDQAQWVFGGAQGTAGVGIAGVSQTMIDKTQAGPEDEVSLSERQIKMRMSRCFKIANMLSRSSTVT